jgi:hypothetical protein
VSTSGWQDCGLLLLFVEFRGNCLSSTLGEGALVLNAGLMRFWTLLSKKGENKIYAELKENNMPELAESSEMGSKNGCRANDEDNTVCLNRNVIEHFSRPLIYYVSIQ